MRKHLTGSLRRWKLELGLDLPPSSGTREALQYLMMARLGVLYVVLGGVVLHQVFRGESVPERPLFFGYGLLALSFAFNLVQAMWLHRLPSHGAIAVVNIAFDSVVISDWIFLSGGQGTLFALLYLVQILVTALTFYKRGAAVGAAIACAGFGFVCWLRPPQEGLLIWGIYSALFVTLGVVGGYLSEELLRTTESLREESRKIEKLQEFYEKVISNLPTGLLTVDGLMRINFLNPAGEHILGHRLVDIIGKPLSEVEPDLIPFFDKIDMEDLAEDVADPVSGEDTVSRLRSEFHTSHFVHPRKNEKTRLQQTVEVGKGTKVRLIRGDVAELDVDAPLGRLMGTTEQQQGAKVLLFQDVTKLLHLEDRLKQNEKLAAVGQLAAGIAHEIRNPLASMSGSIQLLQTKLGPVDAENRKLMDIAVREIDRLNNLISEFLDFVKPERPRMEGVSLPKLCADLVLQLRNSKEFRPGVELIEAYDQTVTASANSEKLKQVLWNLLVNALQAMDKPGRIEVGCAPAGGHRVKLWVEDQGQGMTEEVLAHLYEPFFTTKQRGTGLGLATAYKIIEALHGEIRVKSKPQAGTRFEIYLQSA